MATPLYVLNTFLRFVEPYTIECFVLFLYFIFKEEDLKYVFLLTICSRFVNALIKSILPISEFPDPSLRGSPFPSGHLQISSVFFLWVFYKYKSTSLRSLVIFILYCGAYVQVYRYFHYTFDVVAACIISFCIVFSFFRFLKNFSDKFKMLVIISFSIISFVILTFYGLDCYQQDEYLIKTSYKILGFSGAYFLIYQYSLKKCYVVTAIVFFISIVFKYSGNAFLNQLYWVSLFSIFPLLKTMDLTRYIKWDRTLTRTSKQFCEKQF